MEFSGLLLPCVPPPAGYGIRKQKPNLSCKNQIAQSGREAAGLPPEKQAEALW